MFSRISTIIAVLSVVSFAAALPQGVAQCNTGPVQCCNSVQSAQAATALFGLLGLVDGTVPVQGLFGAQCDPITGIGAGGAPNCNQQPVCCTGTGFNGLVNVGCTPINIGA